MQNSVPMETEKKNWQLNLKSFVYNNVCILSTLDKKSMLIVVAELFQNKIIDCQ